MAHQGGVLFSSDGASAASGGITIILFMGYLFSELCLEFVLLSVEPSASTILVDISKQCLD